MGVRWDDTNAERARRPRRSASPTSSVVGEWGAFVRRVARGGRHAVVVLIGRTRTCAAGRDHLTLDGRADHLVALEHVTRSVAKRFAT